MTPRWLVRAWDEALEEARERALPRRVLGIKGFRQPKRGLWRLEMPGLRSLVPAAPRWSWQALAGVVASLGAVLLWHVSGFVPGALMLPLFGMATLGLGADTLPVVESTADRNAHYPSPLPNQHVFNKGTGNMERFDPAIGWVTEVLGVGPTGAGVPGTSKTVSTALYARGTSGNVPNDNAVAVNAAVAAAPGLGATIVNVVGAHLPFTAGNVTFNNAVKMTAEGYDGLYFNVRAYGAAGDGVADDTVACRAAISAAANATSALQFFTGGVVYFPSGEYICTGTLQMPAAVNQGSTTLRGAHQRSTTLLFKGATTNFTAAPTTPALVLMGSAAPDAAGTSTNITQFCGIEHLTINGTLLTGGGNVRGVQLTEAQNCWMENVLINNLPNSSTGLYLRGSTITSGLGGTNTRPETRECRFLNVVVDNTVGSGATSTPSALILQNADENNFYNCVFGVTPGLTGTGARSIFAVWIQCGRQNRFYGMLIAGDSTANKTQYVAEVFGPPINEAGAANGTVLQNQTYGDWIEGFDVCLWNRADNSGNTTGNAIYNVNPAIYNTVFLDDNQQFRTGQGGFLSFVVVSPGLGPPDGPINYYGGTRPPYSNTIQWVSGNATPDVSGGQLFLTNNAAPTTITNFLNPKPGQSWTVIIGDANTKIQHDGVNIVLQGNTNATLPQGSCITFFYDGQATFHKVEVSRTVTGLRAQVALAWGATPALDASQADYFTLAATSNIAATIGVPFVPPAASFSKRIVIAIRNSTGGALTTPVAFNAGANGFKTTGGVSPANGVQIEVTFDWDPVQSFWYEIARSAAL